MPINGLSPFSLLTHYNPPSHQAHTMMVKREKDNQSRMEMKWGFFPLSQAKIRPAMERERERKGEVRGDAGLAFCFVSL